MVNPRVSSSQDGSSGRAAYEATNQHLAGLGGGITAAALQHDSDPPTHPGVVGDRIEPGPR